MVIDNSVVMAWCFREASPYAQSVLDILDFSEAIAPSVWPLEVGNTLLVAERRKRLSREDAAGFVAALNDMSIVVEQETPMRMLTEILALARERQLSTYDASYLDLAMRRGLPLATLDKSLKRAAGKCGVPLFRR